MDLPIKTTSKARARDILRAKRGNCKKWGVVTTIFPPSESVRRFLYKDDWCIVVVADLNKPEVFERLFLTTFIRVVFSFIT